MERTSIELSWSNCVDANGHKFWWLQGIDFLSDSGIELCRIDQEIEGFKVSLIVREDDDGADHEFYGKFFVTLEAAQEYAMSTLKLGGWYPNHQE